MARFLNDNQPKYTSISLLREVFTVGGAPAVIALIVTVTICYLATVKDSADLQKALVHALTLILGFYFGTKVPKATGARSANKG
jgi:succinylarginine dihydrolase